ncbi:hypothetical protein Tsubulata_000916 [Turnera subulata]|uniref:Uncharacterized protein n=1 Tax=Turnera subulata TaxID=218843 RepID=A0A9Q0G2T9_9ROSI|nr:hypothetical protein Tsubulata_000916 [Turnera subulata]
MKSCDVESSSPDPEASPACRSSNEVENVEAEAEASAAVDSLLEEGWFYGGLLNSGPRRMLRCFSDPSPNNVLGLQTNDSYYSSPKKLSRAPSLPPCIGRQHADDHHHQIQVQPKKSNNNINGRVLPRLTRQLLDQGFVQQPIITNPLISADKKPRPSNKVANPHSLARAPSLTPHIGRRRDQEEDMLQGNNESDITMSLLIRQAMPIPSDIFPRPRMSQVMLRTPPGTPEAAESRSSEKTTRNKSPGPGNGRRIRGLQKSLSDLQFQEVQGFRDLGFTFDKEDLNPVVVERLSSLQAKEKLGGKTTTRSRSRRWGDQACNAQSLSSSSSSSCAPPIPIWAPPKNSTQDMKAQLKFWARAVASNVR